MKLSGHLIYPNFLPVDIAFSIERPNTNIFLLNLTADSIICWILWTLLAKVAIIIRPVAFLNISNKDLDTSLSDLEDPSTSAFVESAIYRVTPCSPYCAIFANSISSPSGVRSILKSPVSTILPFGVSIHSPSESGIEWVVLKKETVICPILTIVDESISLMFPRCESSLSSSLFLINPAVNFDA